MEEEQVGARPNGVSYWRGTVDSRLKNLEYLADEQAAKMDKVLDKIDRIEKTVGAEKGHNVTWSFIREKISVPIFVGVIVIAIDLLLR